MTGPLRHSALADRGGLERRHPRIFRPPPGPRVATVALIVGAVGLAICAMWWLEFSFDRIGSGLVQLG